MSIMDVKSSSCVCKNPNTGEKVQVRKLLYGNTTLEIDLQSLSDATNADISITGNYKQRNLRVQINNFVWEMDKIN